MLKHRYHWKKTSVSRKCPSIICSLPNISSACDCLQRTTGFPLLTTPPLQLHTHKPYLIKYSAPCLLPILSVSYLGSNPLPYATRFLKNLNSEQRIIHIQRVGCLPRQFISKWKCLLNSSKGTHYSYIYTAKTNNSKKHGNTIFFSESNPFFTKRNF